MSLSSTRTAAGMRATAAAFAIFAGALLALMASPARANEPQPRPAAYERTTPDGFFTVTSKLDPPLTSTANSIDPPEAAPRVRMWFIPGYRRNVVVAANGASALVLPDGGNLIASDDPDQTLLTFHRPSKVSSSIRLGDIMRSADLQRTTSHYLWSEGVRAEDGAFVIRLPRGLEARIDAATGGVLASPVGAKSQTDERIVGVAPPDPDAPCLTYDTLRANLTVLGPKEPLPALPAPYAKGCVAGFRDDRVDILKVFEEGVVPAFDPAPTGVLASMEPIWGLVPVGGTVPAGSRSIEIRVSTSLSVGSWKYLQREAWNAPDIDGRNGQFRTISVSGLDREAVQAALESIADRWAGDAVDFKNAQERNDLARLPDGTYHLGVVPAGPGDFAMLFRKRGARLRGLQYAWGTDESPSCFDAELQGDGSTAQGRQVARRDDDRWSERVGLTFDYGRFDTLRPLPPVMAAERVAQAKLDASRDACLAALDAS